MASRVRRRDAGGITLGHGRSLLPTVQKIVHCVERRDGPSTDMGTSGFSLKPTSKKFSIRWYRFAGPFGIADSKKSLSPNISTTLQLIQSRLVNRAGRHPK